MITATYSPDDNKLRLYASERLPRDLYDRLRAAGFIWAPKQDLFVSPAWTPAREDLAIELAGEIDDEDKSLLDRAEERAERFDEYHDARTRDYDAAHKAVSAIADNIPLGQPILVGHHSERHARRDAERIENGMRRAVKMWETAEYWTRRAKGAIRHAKYKERPDVRARRIKKLESERRKCERNLTQCEKFLKVYSDPEAIGRTLKDGRALLPALLATYEGGLSYDEQRALERGELSPDAALTSARDRLARCAAVNRRWIEHYGNRIAYERVMLDDQGGTEAERVRPEKGGACRCWASPPGGYSYIHKVNQVSVSVLDNWGNGGENFPRTIAFDKLTGLMSAADVQAARDTGRLVEIDARGFILRNAPPAKPAPEEFPEPRQVLPEDSREQDAARLKAALREGVQVVSAPQLFPTPPELAARMVRLANLSEGHRILEPSAGTGRIVDAILAEDKLGHIVAVEIRAPLADQLGTRYRKRIAPPTVEVIRADFLTIAERIGTFDRVLMNPPFQHADDVRHIERAIALLGAGGRLVAICANGPRQQAALKPRALEWYDLEPGTFKEQGTGVNVALLVIEKEEAQTPKAARPPQRDMLPPGQQALDLN